MQTIRPLGGITAPCDSTLPLRGPWGVQGAFQSSRIAQGALSWAMGALEPILLLVLLLIAVIATFLGCSNAHREPTLPNVRFTPDCVAKVGGMRRVRNNRIQKACRVNQSCAAT
jgi:hypothetical protein